MSYNSNDMMAKIQGLSLGEKLVGGGSILMVIAALFLPWIKVSVKGAAGIGGGSVSRAATGDPAGIWGILIILVALVLAGVIIGRVLNMNMPALPNNLTWGQVFGGLAALEVILVVLKAWRIQAVDVGLCGDACSKSFGFGFFIGIVAVAAIGYGGYLLYSEDKGSGFSMGGGGSGFRR